LTAGPGALLTELALRVGPVLIFLIAITVVAEIADAAGVFDIAGHWAARAGHGRTWLLWLLVVALSCLSTIVLSLDTTAVAAIGATVAVLAILHLRDLGGRYRAEAPPAPHDRVLLIVAATVCVALGPAFVSGIAPAIPASAAALILAGTILVRNRPLLRTVTVPWHIVAAISALFVVVDLALGTACASCSPAGRAPVPGRPTSCESAPSGPVRPTWRTTCPPTWPWSR